MVEKPKLGRPPRHAGERMAKNRTFKIWNWLDDALQAEAEQWRRTVSAEIEFRLELSFRVDRLDAQMRALFGIGLKEGLLFGGGLGEAGGPSDETVKRWAARIAKAQADLKADFKAERLEIERLADIEAKEQRRPEQKRA
jgi:hypothetical protein